ncbi:resistance protein candidate RGC20 [Tanacetum coccineum]
MQVIEQPLPHAMRLVLNANNCGSISGQLIMMLKLRLLVLCWAVDPLNYIDSCELHFPYDMVRNSRSMFEKKTSWSGEVGHWKRNCHVYLAELQKKRKQVGSASSSVLKTVKHNLDSYLSMALSFLLILNKKQYYVKPAAQDGLFIVRSAYSLISIWFQREGRLRTPSMNCGMEMFQNLSYLKSRISGRAVDLEEFREIDTTPSEITKSTLSCGGGSWVRSILTWLLRPLGEQCGFLREELTWMIWQMDVKAYLLCSNGYLDEDIMMVQPEGFVVPNHPRKRSIMYAVRCTRPDVAFAQNMTSRFQRILVTYGLLRSGLERAPSKSTTAMSVTESEYIAASEAAMEAVWIRKFISGLGIVPTINEPLKMYCDNSAAVHYANEPELLEGAGHYQRDDIIMLRIDVVSIPGKELNDDVSKVAFPSYLLHTFHHLHKLELWDYKAMEVVFEIMSPNLLELKYLKNFKCIGGVADCISADIQDQLKLSQASRSWSLCQYAREISITHCDVLSSVIPWYAVGQMQKLQVLKIKNCKSMTEVFETQEINNKSGTDTGKSLPRLEYITMLTLPKLKILKIQGCHLLKHVFTFSTLKSLAELEELEIKDCKAMEVIVNQETGDQKVVFPHLKSLILVNLPNFVGFFLGKNEFTWPTLEKVAISECPQITVFTYGPSTARKLNFINTSLGKHSVECGLNFHVTTTSHQHFKLLHCPTAYHGITLDNAPQSSILISLAY